MGSPERHRWEGVGRASGRRRRPAPVLPAADYDRPPVALRRSPAPLAVRCSATSSAVNLPIVSGSVNTASVLFCALYPGPPGWPFTTNVPSPDALQFVDPSKPTRASMTPPLV